MRAYTRFLAVTLRFRALTLLVGLGAFAASIWSTSLLPTGFIPAPDEAARRPVARTAAGLHARRHPPHHRPDRDRVPQGARGDDRLRRRRHHAHRRGRGNPPRQDDRQPRPQERAHPQPKADRGPALRYPRRHPRRPRLVRQRPRRARAGPYPPRLRSGGPQRTPSASSKAPCAVCPVSETWPPPPAPTARKSASCPVSTKPPASASQPKRSATPSASPPSATSTRTSPSSATATA